MEEKQITKNIVYVIEVKNEKTDNHQIVWKMKSNDLLTVLWSAKGGLSSIETSESIGIRLLGDDLLSNLKQQMKNDYSKEYPFNFYNELHYLQIYESRKVNGIRGDLTLWRLADSDEE